jgi:hypothetical protein
MPPATPEWLDGKRAAILLAFDDNAPTHLDVVIPELEKRQIVGTFYVIPGGNLFQERRAEWQRTTRSSYVVLANHTFTHRGATSVSELERELEQCSEALYALRPELPTPRLLAFGRPGGVPWTVSPDEVTRSLEKFHLIHRPRFDHPATPQKSPEQITDEMLAIVDGALATGEAAQIGFHGVGGDWHSTPLECFGALLDKLEAHRDELWITNPVSLYQFQQPLPL